MSVVGIKGEKFNIANCKKMDVELIGQFGKQQLKGVVTSSNIKLPSQTIPADFIESLKLPEFSKVRPYVDAQVQLLIGQDNWHVITTREVFSVEDYDLAISRSPLGWVLHGPARSKTPLESVAFSVCSTCEQNSEICNQIEKDESLNDLIKQYFDLESIGVVTANMPKGYPDRASKVLENTSCFMGNYWETGLLWKHDQASKVDSYPMAYRRLLLLEKKLNREPEYSRIYYAEMQRFIDNGYAKKVDKNSKQNRIWYLPHFGVTNINKPNKIRLVFDAAAKANGESYNDQLEAGPNLLQSLPGVLIRFRQYKIAYKGDIADMFLRIKVREEDRGAQRFLLRGANGEVDEYESESLIFGSIASPATAIYIKNRNARTFKIKNSNAHEKIEKNSYMDDFLSSCESKSGAMKEILEVKKINAVGGFEMHSWACNDPSVLTPTSTSNTMNKGTRLCDKGEERVLGLVWESTEDVLRFNVKCKKIPTEIITGNKIPTKREVLRVVMSVFDPLGLLAPFTLKSKLLLQEIWRSGIHWDTEIRQEENSKWLAWLSDLQQMKNCSVPRCISIPEAQMDNVELHIFCDASLSGFAAVAYIRFGKTNGTGHISLLMAKSRIAPLKPTTVPRLELQAALLGARLTKYVQNECEFKISRRILWSDSTTSNLMDKIRAADSNNICRAQVRGDR